MLCLGFPAALPSNHGFGLLPACACACCLQAKHGEKKVGFGPELTGKSGGVAVCACAAGCHPPTAGWIGQVSQVPSPSHLGLAGRGRTPDREGLKTFFFNKRNSRRQRMCFVSRRLSAAAAYYCELFEVLFSYSVGHAMPDALPCPIAPCMHACVCVDKLVLVRSATPT